MNIKKLFATLAGLSLFAQTVVPSAGVFGAEYSQELQDAYDWAYSKGVTTMSPIDNANMYGAITRAEMAKMLSVYAKEVLGKTLDTSAACTFTDIDSVKGDLHDFIIESCQLGIMGQGITAFRPYDTISRAEFGTALSRVLWGSEYEGGTPYYANHLNALKSAAIMNQIANAESTKEIRGYVMLMLMRSEQGGATVDCEDPAIALACLDPELDTYKDCPAACREEDSSSSEVVKSGSLDVTSEPEEGKMVVANGATSYLDTLTFKASEDITLNSITLERYGYSTTEDVDKIWLEDSEGNNITNEKSLSPSKDSVTLSIKKEYRTISDKDTITIVIRTAELTGDFLKHGTNIGFKVTDVDCSAKEVNLADYSAYKYDIIDYEGSEVTVELKGKQDKKYNVAAGEYYEIAKVKVSATNSAIDVNGFTLENAGTLDLADNVEKVTVKVDGKEVEGLTYTLKKNSIKVNFDKVSIGINKNSSFAVEVTLKDDFEDYNDTVKLYLKNTSDLRALESKNGVTVKFKDNSKYEETEAYNYIFVGGKVTLSNTKLSATIDAAAGSEDVVIAQGTVQLGGEPINIRSLTITPSVTGTGNVKNIVESIKIYLDDEEIAESDSNWKLTDILIEKEGTLKVVVNLEDDGNSAFAGETISFTPTSLNANTLVPTTGNVEYDNSGEKVDKSNILGSISLSKIKVNESKASLKNTATKAAEFVKGESTKKTIFEGTYTAKKSDIELNEVALIYGATTGFASTDVVTINVEVNGKVVATLEADDLSASTKTASTLTDDDYVDFAGVNVKAEESVTVKVVAEINADEANANPFANQKLTLVLRGDDNNGIAAGRADAKTVEMKITASESVKVTDSGTEKKTVLESDSDVTLAKFTLKPTNGTDAVDLTKLVFTFENFDASLLKADNFDVTVGDTDLTIEDTDFDTTAKTLTLDNFTEEVPVEGVVVEVVYTQELAASPDEDTPYKVTLSNANSATPGTEFARYVVPVLIKLSQTSASDGSRTRFTMDFDADDHVVTGFVLKYEGGTPVEKDEISDGDYVEALGTSDGAKFVTEVSYYVDGTKYTIAKSKYADYFKYNDTYLKVAKAQ